MNGSPDLAPLDATRVAGLEWTQPHRGRRAWELSADGVLVARLEWRGLRKRGYAVRTADHEWAIVHELFGRQRIERENGETIASSRRSGFRTTRIERAAGEALVWRRTGWFRSEHRLENRERFPLFVLRTRRDFLRREAVVTIEEAGRSLPDLLPLLLLTWPLMLARVPNHAA